MVRKMTAITILAMVCTAAIGLEWQFSSPDERALATIIIDAPNRRAVMYGGASGQPYSDVWTLALDSKRGYGWESLATVGPRPRERSGHTTIYDPIHGWMVVFGGRNGMTALNDAAALDIRHESKWRTLETTGQPPRGTVYITAVFCPTRRSMVVFGGNDIYNGYNDVYELQLDSLKWRKLSPSGTPPEARWSYNAFYDPDSCRLMIFGGQTQSAHFVDDVWALDLRPGFEAWRRLTFSGAVPTGRSNCATGYDTVERRAYFFGGFKYTGNFIFYNDLYMLDLRTRAWTRLQPTGRIPSERRCPGGAFDPWNRNFITFGGETYSGFTNEWPYIYVGETSGWHSGEPGEPQLLEVTPVNSRQVNVRISPSVAGTVSVEVVDQSGRVVRHLLSGDAPTGGRDLVWDGRNERGVDVPSGCYFCRLETEDTQLAKKFVLAR